jgi:hypothetical protein
MQRAKGDWIPFVGGAASGGIGLLWAYWLGDIAEGSANRNVWVITIDVAILLPGVLTVFGREMLRTDNLGASGMETLARKAGGILKGGLLWLFGVGTVGAFGTLVDMALR